MDRLASRRRSGAAPGFICWTRRPKSSPKYWEAAAAYPPAIARKAYEDKPSYALIDRNLLAGNPVIIRVRYPGGGTHFVVIVGKQGFDYLIRDPGRGGARGVYPLKDLGLPIEALRFFEKTAPGAVSWPPSDEKH